MTRQENSNAHGLLATSLCRSLQVKEKGSWRIKRLKVALALGVCAVLMLSFFAGRATGVDTVIATITCPLETNVDLNWNDRIGRDPTFEYKHGLQHLPVHFYSMSRVDQTIYCEYQFPPALAARYAYTVKREIKSCTPRAPNVMECKLAK